MKKVSILIPSYKRPEVLDHTLKGLYDNTIHGDIYEVSITVGLNKASHSDLDVVNRYGFIFEGLNIKFHSISYGTNIGKAAVLNDLFDLIGKDSDYIVTLDNDMYIKKPWMHLIEQCDAIDYDIMGFSSAKFWAHDPIRESCPFTDVGDTLFYKPYSVAGGMMLFHSQFLKDHEWSNFGGVYGRDDADMCLKTDKKYVLLNKEDWLDHDPLNSSTAALKAYEEKKKELYKNGVTVFQAGWDE